ncbi:DUF5318 family protein [Corynebacterium otitidis]|uniref:DUF5318 domain-containing protein n=1 Tax=Corynebacterium otitidis ATCC 51513 TaxID=883169 RepID=I7IXM4_9CORY|nr:DUF5318 family protein [Corynebacterium otitidis]EJZ81256.1 hypothetical protein HMPREF9719_01834 [Corynebacterium otitidis ATCC 51513]KKO84120.1 hypothetical protein AAV33_02835 [Corynebacterium otitidis]CCI83923.1 hypothetical protein BN46_1198 [Corynebacterium otitidis ATCC 51513]
MPGPSRLATVGKMHSPIVYGHAISHELERRRVLGNWRAGRVPRRDLCDADFLLRTASSYHGHAADEPCPVCESEQLRHVKWVYGTQLGRRGNTAREDWEIEEIVDAYGEITVHLVEVCPECGWNFLLREMIAYPGERREGRA